MRIHIAGAGALLVAVILMGTALFNLRSAETPGAIELLETGEWRDVVADRFAALEPGMGYIQRVEIFERHGEGAETIREQARPYTPEQRTQVTRHGFDDDGEVSLYEVEVTGDDGDLLMRSSLENAGGELRRIDNRENVPQGEREHTETDLPPGISEVALARDALIANQEARLAAVLDAPGASAPETRDDGKIQVSHETGISDVTGGDDAFTVPYVLDLDASRAVETHIIEPGSLQVVEIRWEALQDDGTTVLLQSWQLQELTIAPASELESE